MSISPDNNLNFAMISAFQVPCSRFDGQVPDECSVDRALCQLHEALLSECEFEGIPYKSSRYWRVHGLPNLAPPLLIFWSTHFCNPLCRKLVPRMPLAFISLTTCWGFSGWEERCPTSRCVWISQACYNRWFDVAKCDCRWPVLRWMPARRSMLVEWTASIRTCWRFWED